MHWVDRLKHAAARIKQEVRFYQVVLQDPRTPKLPKWLLGLAVGYVLLPFDLIPDVIPIIGHLDDLILVPGLVFLAFKLIPSEIVEECRQKTQAQTHNSSPQEVNGGRS